MPVLRALRAELGKDKADDLVKQALRDWSKQLFAAMAMVSRAARGANGRPSKAPSGRSGQEVEVEIRRHDKEALEFDVTRCRFAEFFRALGEPSVRC